MSYSVVNIDDLEGPGPGAAVRFVGQQFGVRAFGINWFELPPNARGHVIPAFALDAHTAVA